MKIRRQKTRRPSTHVLKLAALGGAGLGLVYGVKADSVITFEGFTGDNTPINSLPGFGDNISLTTPDYIASLGLGGILGTPDITLDWVGQWDTYTHWDGRGSVGQSDFNGGSPISIVFTPTAGFGVRLASFDLDEWNGGGDGNISWSVMGANSGVLGSGTFTMVSTGGRKTVSPGVNGQVGEAVTLSLQLNTGGPSYFALDNLTFAQVPEPSALALGALGAVGALGAAAMRRRKRA
jgi:hypothetical protein